MEWKSEAMWTIYSNETDGFRIRTTVGELSDSFAKNNVPYKLSKVRYWNRDKIESYFENGNEFVCEDDFDDYPPPADRCMSSNFVEMAKKFMIKREAFKHEKEVRLICRWDEATRQDKYFPFQVCPEINQIMVHPLVNQSDFETLKCVLSKLEFQGKIKLSKLLGMPSSS